MVELEVLLLDEELVEDEEFCAEEIDELLDETVLCGLVLELLTALDDVLELLTVLDDVCELLSVLDVVPELIAALDDKP